MDFETRKKLWIALSEIYLDTEITEITLYSIVKTAKNENISYDCLYKINKDEVFPVLYLNGLAVLAVWNGFDKDWLVNTISKSLKNNNWFFKKYNTLKYLLFSSFISSSMRQLKLLFEENKKA